MITGLSSQSAVPGGLISLYLPLTVACHQPWILLITQDIWIWFSIQALFENIHTAEGITVICLGEVVSVLYPLSLRGSKEVCTIYVFTSEIISLVTMEIRP